MNGAQKLDVKTERDVNRIVYRPEGARRWTRIAVFPDDGQSLEEVEELAYEIAEMHRAL